MRRKFLQNIGLMSFDMEISEAAEPTISQQLIFLPGGSHVRTSVLPENEQDLMESGADYGESLPESFASYDLVTCLWRTSQLSFILFDETDDLLLQPHLAEFSETWPSSGMMRS